jgi:flagellar hook-length control protein FliK
MIRADLANRLQPAADLALRPALPAREISDKLSGFVAGQRLLAEIQSLLPNGSYRALINQRSMTLALPFAAKTGDAIELEVQESDGKLTLAVVSRAASESGKEGAEAAANPPQPHRTVDQQSLCRRTRCERRAAAAQRQSANRRQSAEWRSGSPAATQAGDQRERHVLRIASGGMGRGALQQGATAAGTAGQARPADSLPRRQPSPAGDTASMTRAAVDAAQVLAKPAEMNAFREPGCPNLPKSSRHRHRMLVQQQLEAFATQNFSWQGQVWPGQQIEWEIENESKRHDTADRTENEKWQTRLRLTLPQLGEVDARLHIQGKQLMLTMIASDTRTRELLRSEVTHLQSQFEQAGLDLASLAIAAPTEKEAHAQRAG